jgi:hypothetical protein
VFIDPIRVMIVLEEKSLVHFNSTGIIQPESMQGEDETMKLLWQAPVPARIFDSRCSALLLEFAQCDIFGFKLLQKLWRDFPIFLLEVRAMNRRWTVGCLAQIPGLEANPERLPHFF